MYRPGRGARKLDRKKSKGADGPSSGATGSFPLEAGVSSRKAASSRQSSADLVLARTRCLCTRVAFPVSHLSRSSSLIAGWCHRFARPPLAHVLSILLSHVSFSTPLGSAVLSGLDVCATKKSRDKRENEQPVHRRQCMPQGDGAKCSSDRATLSNDKTKL